jgi:hypothetical protein
MCSLVLFFFKLLFNKFYVLCVTLCCFFLNCCLINFMCVDFYYKFYVFFYYKFILTREFSKHDKVNYLCCDIRYILIFIFCLAV